MPSHTNRLISEKSPYLLQHAHNPVDWFPWGVEAFDCAKTLNKPIFLSIGYATCHWCHVMERESFENVEIAALMNEAFVNIKVDREELPEVDGLYMEFAQVLMASSGGWPLNVILTPNLKPFFAVTYLPPENRRGLIGMRQFVQHIQQLWQSEDKEELIEQSDKIVDLFQRAEKSSGAELPTLQELKVARHTLYEMMDPLFGGLKGEPKFPLGYQALFLLASAKEAEDSRPLFCVEMALNGMRKGGIYDQLGGGFSRYAVDEKWLIPHFEKMLYDNALIAEAYLSCWKYKKDPSHSEIAAQTLDYLLSQMQHPEGGFYTAEDADSKEGEGRFYTWTRQEIQELLSPEDAEIFCSYYGVTAEGNFEGRTVLHIATSLEDSLQKRIESSRSVLLKQRSLRPAPLKDDKIITSYNGLIIDVLAKAGVSLQRESFTQAALKAAHFIKDHLFKENRLLRRYREGEARFEGGLEDYAYLIRALLTLFELGHGTIWLDWALLLSQILNSDFKSENGVFYSHVADPNLLVRRVELYDGAEPCGNAVHCENLLRLYRLTQEEHYLSSAEKILKAAKDVIQAYPPGACYHLWALSNYLDHRALTIVVALDQEGSLKEEIKKFLNQQFIPHLTVIWKEIDDDLLIKLIPSLVDKNPIDGQTAVYICRQTGCEPPLIELPAIFKRIEENL